MKLPEVPIVTGTNATPFESVLIRLALNSPAASFLSNPKPPPPALEPKLSFCFIIESTDTVTLGSGELPLLIMYGTRNCVPFA